MSMPRRLLDTADIRIRHARVAASHRCALARPRQSCAYAATAAALIADIPAMCDEVDLLRSVIAVAQRDHRDLVAAARAALKADSDGEADPLYYLRDELCARGLLPGNRGDQAW